MRKIITMSVRKDIIKSHKNSNRSCNSSRKFLSFLIACLIGSSIGSSVIAVEDSYSTTSSSKVSNATDEQLSFIQADLINSDFQQNRFISLNGKLFKAFGKMAISSSYGLCWRMQKPFVKTWHFSDQGMREAGSDGKFENIVDATDPMIGMLIKLMNQMVNGDFSALREQFEVVINTDSNESNKSNELTDSEDSKNFASSSHQQAEIFLTPKDEMISKVIHHIRLSVKDGFITAVKIVEYSNSYTELLFLNPKRLDKDSVKLEEFCSAEG